MAKCQNAPGTHIYPSTCTLQLMKPTNSLTVTIKIKASVVSSHKKHQERLLRCILQYNPTNHHMRANQDPIADLNGSSCFCVCLFQNTAFHQHRYKDTQLRPFLPSVLLSLEILRLLAPRRRSSRRVCWLY